MKASRRSGLTNIGQGLTFVLLASTNVTAGLAQQTESSAQSVNKSQDAVAEPLREFNPESVNEAIIVTGSRIQRSGFQQPTPVTVLSAEALQDKAPTSISDALKQLPQFTGSSGQSGSLNLGETTGATAGGSGTYLNLYNLGANRLLVLQDGRRVLPNISGGAVDAGLIPQMLVKRVDVITGGASATYGSDAIAGVVNYVMDHDFEGVRTNAQAGISSRGDAEHYRLGVAAGIGLLDDRLHIIGSAETYHNAGIPNYSDREFGKPGPTGGYTVAGGKFGAVSPNGALAGKPGNPYVIYNDVHIQGATVNGVFNSGPLAGSQIINGAIVPRPLGTPVSGFTCNGCADNYVIDMASTTLVQKKKTDQAYARVQYDISPDTNIWIAGGLSRSRVSGTGANSFFNGGQQIFNDNAYLTPEARAILANTPVSAFGHSFQKALPFNEFALIAKSRTVSLGMKGKIWDWNWDVNYWNDRASTRFISRNEANLPRFFAAMDAVTDPTTGRPVCRVTLTNPGLYPGCVPINPFGPNSISAEAKSYINGSSTFLDTQSVSAVSANLSGDLFSLWAGPVSFALGAEYRKQRYELTSNSDPRNVQVTGIRGVISPGPYQYINVTPSDGEQTVKEAYAELVVPLAKDVPLLRLLEFTGAARITDYRTSGSITSWKLGAVWKPIDDIRLRATLSRDIRAPSLGELFAGLRTGPGQTVTDTHTGAANVLPVRIFGGNADLKPEKSDSLVAGMVVTPRGIPGLNLSVDYFRFKVSDAVGNLPYTPQQIIDICEQSGGTDPVVCPLIIRPLPFSDHSTANNVTQMRIVSVNVAQFNVSGFNFEGLYTHSLFGGDISARVLATYLTKYSQRTAPGQPVTEFLGNADGFGGVPKFRGTAELKYSAGPFSLRVQERMIGSLNRSVRDSWEANRIPAQFYTDMSMSYDLKLGGGDAQLFVDAQNIFDKNPPLSPTNCPCGTYPTLSALYDIVGAYFTMGVRVKW